MVFAPCLPLLHWLSGLTCTDENLVTKAGLQRYAAEHGIAILVPDTSPRTEGMGSDLDFCQRAAPRGWPRLSPSSCRTLSVCRAAAVRLASWIGTRAGSTIILLRPGKKTKLSPSLANGTLL